MRVAARRRAVPHTSPRRRPGRGRQSMISAAFTVRPQALLAALTLVLALGTASPRAYADVAPDSSKAAAAVVAPAASGTPDITGTWILDRKSSDDLSKLRPPGGEGRGGGG